MFSCHRPEPTVVKPLPTNLSDNASLEARMRAILRDLPREHAALLEALLQERDRQVATAERRAERVQRLHEAASSLLRTLERDELELEVALQLLRVIQADGVVVARPPVVAGEPPEAKVHVTPAGQAPLDAADQVSVAFTEVIRTGRPARVNG